MDLHDVVGSWNAVSGDSNLWLKDDGTYIRVSNLAMPMTYTKLAIDEAGAYEVLGDRIRFSATNGHYRRNGVDEGFEPKVYEQQARLAFDPQSGDTLILENMPWTREVA